MTGTISHAAREQTRGLIPVIPVQIAHRQEARSRNYRRPVAAPADSLRVPAEWCTPTWLSNAEQQLGGTAQNPRHRQGLVPSQ